MARDLKVALVVRAVDKATKPLQKIGLAVGRVARKTGLDRVGRNLGAVGRRMKTVAAEAGLFALKMGAAFAAVGGAMFGATQHYAKSADFLAKMSDRIGIGIEDLQRLQHAFDLGGVDREKAARAMLYFTARIGEATRGTGEAAEVFKVMGISIRDMNGAVRPTREIFDEVADAMGRQESTAKAAYASQMLFGRAGRQMVKVMQQGSAGIREQGAEMDTLGLITEAEARAAEGYIDDQARMKTAFSRLTAEIGKTLLPAMQGLTRAMTEFFVEIRPEVVEEFDKFMRNVSGAVGWLGRTVTDATGKVGGFFDGLRETFPFIGDWVEAIKSFARETGVLTIIFALLTAVIAKKFLTAVAGLVAPLAKLGASILAVAARALIFAFVLFYSAAQKAFPLFKRGLAAAGKAVKAFGRTFLVAGGILLVIAAIAAAAYMIYEEWETITGWFDANIWKPLKDGFQAVLDFFSNPVGGLFDWIGDMLPGWVKDLLGIGGGATAAATAATAAMPAIPAVPLPVMYDAPVVAGGRSVLAQRQGDEAASLPASLPASIGAAAPLGGGLVPGDREAPRGGRLGIGRNARIEVDFRNLPSYARVNTDPGDADLDVTAGYSMAGAA